jgi:hypothetical protein
MTSQPSEAPTIPLMHVLVIGIFSGLVLGLLTFSFTKPLTIFFLGSRASTSAVLLVRGIVAGIVNLSALIPVIAVLQYRRDLMTLILLGPQMGFWSFCFYLAVGTYRWGPPPSAMWTMGGCYVLYVIFVSLIGLLIVKRIKKKSKE